jgi:hypothetical protein
MATKNETIKPIKTPFDNVWQELELRHAWQIKVTGYNNPEPVISRFPFVWSDYDNQFAVAFRDKYRLNEVVAGAADDWEAFLRLRHWVFINMVNHTEASLPLIEPFTALDPDTLVAASHVGGTFWCSFFSMVMVAAASAVGLPARKLSVDSEHTADEKSTHHGVVDVWTNRFRKWAYMDPNYDHHYELDGIPQSTEEIATLWIKKRGRGLKAMIGPECRHMPRARAAKRGLPEACGCFWHQIELRNDIFRRDGHGSPSLALLPVDEVRQKQRWMQGSPPDTFEKPGYENGMLHLTTQMNEAYPSLDDAVIKILPPHKMPYYCRVQFYSPCSPYFSHYEISVDGGTPIRMDGHEYPWRLHTGICTFEVRTVSHGGWRGAPFTIRLNIRNKAGVKPKWP